MLLWALKSIYQAGEQCFLSSADTERLSARAAEKSVRAVGLKSGSEGQIPLPDVWLLVPPTTLGGAWFLQFSSNSTHTFKGRRVLHFFLTPCRLPGIFTNHFLEYLGVPFPLTAQVKPAPNSSHLQAFMGQLKKLGQSGCVWM